MNSLSKEIELENNIQILDNTFKNLGNNAHKSLSTLEKEELINKAKKFGITPVTTTSTGEKFTIHYDQNQNLRVYPFQSKEKLREELSTLAETEDQKKEYLSAINEGGIKFFTIDNKKLMYHPELNTLINIGLTQPKLKEVKEPLFQRIFNNLLNLIIKKEKVIKLEIDYDTKREDLLNKFSEEEKNETIDIVERNKENEKLVDQFIVKNPSYLLHLKNPSTALSIHLYSNLTDQEQNKFRELNPKMIKSLDFFIKNGLDKKLSEKDIEDLLKGKTSSIIDLDIKNQKITGKIKLSKDVTGEIKATLYKQKKESIQNHEVYKKLRSEEKKRHLLTGGILPIETKGKEIKFYEYDKELNDIKEINISDLNIPQQLIANKTNKQVISMFMGQPQTIDLEIEGIQVPGIEVVIEKSSIKIGGEESGLVKEKEEIKETLVEKTKEEIISEIVNDKTKTLDQKLKAATDKKVGLKAVLDGIEEQKKKPKKIKIVSKAIQEETKKALTTSLDQSKNFNEYLENISRNHNISVWVAYDQENSTISGISYKKDDEIILGKEAPVGLKDIIEKYGKDSIKQENIDNRYLVNQIEDNKDITKGKSKSL